MTRHRGELATDAFAVVKGLLYPSVLGACIAWWFQGAMDWRRGVVHPPTVWALAFGLWFLIISWARVSQCAGVSSRPRF